MAMKKHIISFLFLSLFFQFFYTYSSAQSFELVTSRQKVSIVYDPAGPALDSISAWLLAKDIERVTGYLPAVGKTLQGVNGNVIAIGNYKSSLVQSICGNRNSYFDSLENKWECYLLKTFVIPPNNSSKALVIAGSDTRGTAYGVFAISKKIGVSPWYWWADVPPQQTKELILNIAETISSSPTVKYRGIFLNDEDWGLQPWAAKTFEPETGDIGPKTYAKIFELLLRLKANLIWPAMHPSTKPFYSYEKNKKVAADYSIIVGSSHAEPMLRNNVGEWDSKTMGAFNYITNQPIVYKYWEDRVKESSNNNAIYTIGMRGIHDSGMEGVKDAKEAIPLLTKIIADQRGILSKYINPNPEKVPQVFTVYKEVLDIYDKGLKIPDDVTIVWPDDNYGYIQRLNNPEENKRSGGSGVYYHASYWGRPHDYLWLSSTHPELIREEMMKAYYNNANRLWILNVGDIKPLEYNIQLFLDMAFDARPFANDYYIEHHLQKWYDDIFGWMHGKVINQLFQEYYDLAFERRPEFMGWSQTEPTTKTNYTTYNHFYYGDEAQHRIDQYDQLERRAKSIRSGIEINHVDAYYQLVYYPIVCASLMNKKFLYRDKSLLYAKQGRLSAKDYARLSKEAFNEIKEETEIYNMGMAAGKWKYMMSMAPRNLPVYNEPVLPEIVLQPSNSSWKVVPEGNTGIDSAFNDSTNLTLPAFSSLIERNYFIDIFLCDSTTVKWTAQTEKWIYLTQTSGVLNPSTGRKENRIWVYVDWERVRMKEWVKKEFVTGKVVIKGAGKTYIVNVKVNLPAVPAETIKIGFEENGYISLFVENFSKKENKNGAEWSFHKGVARTARSIVAATSSVHAQVVDTNVVRSQSAFVEYSIHNFTATDPVITIYSLPVHPLNNQYSLRYAISLDNGPIFIADTKTIGRSEEWKQNVLSNQAERKFKLPFLPAGLHKLRIYAIDPGVTLERFVIDLGGLQKSNSVIKETTAQQYISIK
jgi:hypothetical protein